MPAQLFYVPFDPVFTSRGLPAGAAQAFFYYTGTTTLAPIYADGALTIRHDNPIRADNLGRLPSIYLDDTTTYRVRILDGTGAQIGADADPYIPGNERAGPAGPASNTRQSLAELKAAPVTDRTSLYLGDVWTWTLGDYSGRADDATIVQANGVPLSTGAWIRSINAGIVAASYSTLAGADNAAGGSPLLLSGILNITAPYTIKSPISDTLRQLFTPASAQFVRIDNGQEVRPEWFGPGTNNTAGVVALACQACAPGGTVRLRKRRYQSGYDAAPNDGTGTPDVSYLAKAISVLGDGVPTPNSANTALENGSVIEGPFFVAASGSTFGGFGVDSGVAVTDARYGGAAKDGFMLFQPNQAAAPAVKNVAIGSISALGRGKTIPFHGILLEGVNGLGLTGKQISYMFGIGCAIKSFNVTFDTITVVEGGNFGLYLKSDSYAPMYNVRGKVVDIRQTSSVDGVGCIVQAATANSANVLIGEVVVNGKSTCLVFQTVAAAGAPGGAWVLQGCRVGKLYGDGCVNLHYNYGGQFCGIEEMVGVNGTNGITVFEDVTLPTCDYGSLTLTNFNGVGVVARGLTSLRMGNFANVNTLFRMETASARLRVGAYRYTTAANIWTFDSGSTSLVAPWTTATGSDAAYIAEPWGNLVRLRGSVTGGTSAQLIAALPPGLRPTKTVRRQALGVSGSTYAPVEIQINPDGTVSVTNFASASTRLVLDGVEWEAA